MAVAFLAISRRERGSVTTSTDTATARLAADAALASAQAQIISSASRHHQSVQLRPARLDELSSTRYGFVTGSGQSDQCQLLLSKRRSR